MTVDSVYSNLSWEGGSGLGLEGSGSSPWPMSNSFCLGVQADIAIYREPFPIPQARYSP